nr:MAG TPA: hypothetical protein [Caudoviricetes sp.]
MAFNLDLFYEEIINKDSVNFYIYIEDVKSGINLTKSMPTLTALLNWDYNCILDLQSDYQSGMYEKGKVFEMINNEIFEIVNFDEIEDNRAIINNLTQEDYENGYSWIDENNIILLASSKCENNEIDFKEYAQDRIKELNIAIFTLISIFVIVSIVYGLFLLNLGSLSSMIVFGLIYLIGAFLAYVKIKDPIMLKKKLKSCL